MIEPLYPVRVIEARPIVRWALALALPVYVGLVLLMAVLP